LKLEKIKEIKQLKLEKQLQLIPFEFITDTERNRRKKSQIKANKILNKMGDGALRQYFSLK